MADRLPAMIADQTELPVIAAPMFLVSSPELVIEGCKAGVIGSFPLLNARTSEQLEEWMKQISEELAAVRENHPDQRIAPWAVNLIVHRTNQRYDVDVELIKKYRPPIVITSLGKPNRVVEIVHQYGGLVFSDVSNLAHAKKAAATGVDGLILVCNGAGGHAGTLNPFAFMGAVKEFWEGITILAGCISDGEDILAAKAMGADLAYMGTRFIATSESMANEDYQDMLTTSTLDDLIYTDAFSGVHANYLVPSIQRAGLDPDRLQKKEDVDFSKLQASGAKAWKDIWSAGQGVNRVKSKMPVSDLIQELKDEYEQALASLAPTNTAMKSR